MPNVGFRSLEIGPNKPLLGKQELTRWVEGHLTVDDSPGTEEQRDKKVKGILPQKFVSKQKIIRIEFRLD